MNATPTEALSEIADCLVSKNEKHDSGRAAPNVVDGLYAIAKAFETGAKQLGNADAATPMGAIEGLGLCLTNAAEMIAHSIDGLTDAIGEHFGD
jgi:hypothetical protein